MDDIPDPDEPALTPEPLGPPEPAAAGDFWGDGEAPRRAAPGSAPHVAHVARRRGRRRRHRWRHGRRHQRRELGQLPRQRRGRHEQRNRRRRRVRAGRRGRSARRRARPGTGRRRHDHRDRRVHRHDQGPERLDDQGRHDVVDHGHEDRIRCVVRHSARRSRRGHRDGDGVQNRGATRRRPRCNVGRDVRRARRPRPRCERECRCEHRRHLRHGRGDRRVNTDRHRHRLEWHERSLDHGHDVVGDHVHRRALDRGFGPRGRRPDHGRRYHHERDRGRDSHPRRCCRRRRWGTDGRSTRRWERREPRRTRCSFWEQRVAGSAPPGSADPQVRLKG